MRYSGDKRPLVDVSIGGVPIKALLDTGSAVSLCNSKLLRSLKTRILRLPRRNMDLRAANGESLRVSDIRRTEIHLHNSTTPAEMIFVDDLQVPCILGMDYLNQAGIIIDAGERKLLFKSKSTENRSAQTNQFLISTDNDITVQPMQESKVIFNTPTKFQGKGLISSHPQLNNDLSVMDGVIASNGLNRCAAILLNTSQQPIFLAKNSPLAKIDTCPENHCKPVNEVLTVYNGSARITDTAHLKNIDLSHVPGKYLSQYQSLLASFADVFSKHDLDVGHCKTLPHHVRLTDPNRIVSINQYRLPYHLKEVAIDYVDKLLR